MTAFSALALRAEIQAALAAQGYVSATPIQAQAIPPALDGRDILGIAQTGTGKTAAFTLPLLERLSATPASGPGIRALILTPTRELAIQIDESIAAYGAGLAVRHAVIFGGVGQKPQVDALNRGIDFLVATPGRLIDLMNQGHVKLDRLEAFVLDEADRMLDMGFIRDVRRVVAKLPQRRQSLFFSATMPGEVADLANALLRDPVRVEVTPVATTAERIVQCVIHIPAADKRQVLVDLLRNDAEMSRTIVFTRTKHGADRVAKHLERAEIRAAAIHGNKSQNNRQAALEGFRTGAIRVLVATDIAARGIDVDGVSHVINFELPNEPESYVHRIGRTARAGASGSAIALCDEGEERSFLRSIEKLTRQSIPVASRPPATAPVAIVDPPRPPLPPRQGRGAQQGRGGQAGQQRTAQTAQPRTGQPAGQRSGQPAQQRPVQAGAAKPAAAPAQKAQPQRPAERRRTPAPAPHSERAHAERARTERPHADRPHHERSAPHSAARGATSFGDLVANFQGQEADDRPQPQQNEGARHRGRR